MTPRKILLESDISEVYGGFKSLFQGDHLGVEFALASHSCLLKTRGLLQADSTILRHHPFPQGPLWQGLVIDDFFCISREAAGLDSSKAASVAALEKAEEIYRDHQVRGSDDRTV